MEFNGSSSKELVVIEGFEDSRKMLRNYKELKVWKKFYQLCLEIYGITKEVVKYVAISNRRKPVRDEG